MSTSLKPETVVPSESDRRLAGAASRKLAELPRRRRLRIRLDDEVDVEVPASAVRLIERLFGEMAAGNAVTIAPAYAELTTQEAADILSVSRPYLVRLLEEGKLPFHKTGTHRRVRLADVVAFRNAVESDRKRVLAELSEQAQALKLGY